MQRQQSDIMSIFPTAFSALAAATRASGVCWRGEPRAAIGVPRGQCRSRPAPRPYERKGSCIADRDEFEARITRAVRPGPLLGIASPLYACPTFRLQNTKCPQLKSLRVQVQFVSTVWNFTSEPTAISREYPPTDQT